MFVMTLTDSTNNSQALNQRLLHRHDPLVVTRHFFDTAKAPLTVTYLWAQKSCVKLYGTCRYFKTEVGSNHMSGVGFLALVKSWAMRGSSKVAIMTSFI